VKESAKAHQHRGPSPLRLRWDIASMRAWVWFAHPAVIGVLSPDAHLFLSDRYGLLARYHRRLGHEKRAQKLDATAARHFRLGGGHWPPPAVAMAMAAPQPWKIVDAIARIQLKGPHGVA
jgi:hypothetical protein